MRFIPSEVFLFIIIFYIYTHILQSKVSLISFNVSFPFDLSNLELYLLLALIYNPSLALAESRSFPDSPSFLGSVFPFFRAILPSSHSPHIYLFYVFSSKSSAPVDQSPSLPRREFVSSPTHCPFSYPDEAVYRDYVTPLNHQ